MFDFDGGARSFGTATDMGADEFGSGAATVLTGGASDITPAGAVVSGIVNPNGVQTSGYFDYGVTTAYGSQSTIAPVGSDFAAHSVVATLSGLSPSTTYRYRIVGTSGT